jgi:hypothetical protein
MKILPTIFISVLCIITSCSTTKPATDNNAAPETVMVTYHVKLGSEAELEQVLSQAWGIYQKEHLVFSKPHIIVRNKESVDKTRFTEIFTWVSQDAPDNAPDSVKTVWGKMMSLCEKRNGHEALEFSQVEIVQPAK